MANATMGKKIIIPLLIFTLAGGAGYWYWYANIRGYVATDDAWIDGNKVTISAKILGRIRNLLVNEGDQVKRGQTLVELDDSDLNAVTGQSVALVNQAEHNVDVTKITLTRAEEDFQRAETQFKMGITSKEQYDHAKNALEAARAAFAAAQASVETAAATVKVNTTQLRNTIVASPLTGVIAKRWVLTGDVVQAGQSILTVYDVNHIWITANFEETKLGVIHTGQPVEITVDAYPGTPFSGKVVSLGTNTAAQFSLLPPDNSAGNFTKVTQRVPVKISVDRKDTQYKLLPGMSVVVKVKVK